MLSLGLMSGTSMDGIDAALIETDGTEQQLKSLGHITITYASPFKILLKAAEYAVRTYQGDLNQAQQNYSQALQNYLNHELYIEQTQLTVKLNALSAYLYGENNTYRSPTLQDVITHSTELHGLAVKKLLEETGYSAHQIDVIGYHGQTLFHQPSQKKSVIVGHGQMLADKFGVTVVNDFRSQDLAAGGQGAPFAPLYHQALAIHDQKIPAAVVNCGGIANITFIPNHNPLELIAFDTGPGNGLIDRFIRQATQGQEHMDTHGQYGLKGKICEAVHQALYEKSVVQDGKNYFDLTPPKSLDIGDLKLIPEIYTLSLYDACATLEAFTANTIVDSLKYINLAEPSLWILAGGGWNNLMIRQYLEKRIQELSNHTAKVLQAQEIGWNNQALEAQIFAYLAVRSLQGKAISFPGTTGVPQPQCGGRTYFPQEQHCLNFN